MSIKFSQLPNATLPLTGDEITAIVKDGVSVQVALSDFPAPALGTISLSGELAFVAAAGNNNNVALGSSYNSLLVDTAAGAAVITGIAAGTSGQICVVTNTGANNLDLSVEDANSVAANRIYGAVTLTLLPHQSRMLVYSTTLNRWRLV